MKSAREIRQRLKHDREWLDHPNNHGDKRFQEGFVWALRWVLGEFEDDESSDLDVDEFLDEAESSDVGDILESLPNRPLTRDELHQIADHDDVAGAAGFGLSRGLDWDEEDGENQ